jgi:hypothetical protein
MRVKFSCWSALAASVLAAYAGTVDQTKLAPAESFRIADAEARRRQSSRSSARS